jgi:hypothetical protein
MTLIAVFFRHCFVYSSENVLGDFCARSLVLFAKQKRKKEMLFICHLFFFALMFVAGNTQCGV